MRKRTQSYTINVENRDKLNTKYPDFYYADKKDFSFRSTQDVVTKTVRNSLNDVSSLDSEYYTYRVDYANKQRIYENRTIRAYRFE